MTAPLSIIIPTLNADKSLIRILPQLFEGLTEGMIAELIFADGGSTDQTEAIAEESGARFLKAPKGRGNQLARGGEEAKGEWLFFLHADSDLPDRWTSAVIDHIQSHHQKAAAFRLGFDDPSMKAKLTAGWANLRSRLFHLPYGDQGLLISASHYRKIGGYDPIPLMEDVAIAKKLRGHLRILPQTMTTSAEKYRTQGWFKRGLRNLSTLLQYKLGRAPDRLVRGYDSLNHKG